MHPCEGMIGAQFGIRTEPRPTSGWAKWCAGPGRSSSTPTWKPTCSASCAKAPKTINVFAHNLHDLLLAAPAGPRATLGLDPGLRTGCKVAVVDATGKLLDHATVYPHVPHNNWDQTIAILAALCAKHSVDLIAIGNGTASRETDKLAAELIKNTQP
jgi:uncharacterized protein